MAIKARIKDGWIICSKCGKKIAKLVDDHIEYKCKDTRCSEINIIDLGSNKFSKKELIYLYNGLLAYIRAYGSDEELEELSQKVLKEMNYYV